MRLSIKIHGGTLLIAIILFGFSCNKNKDFKKPAIQASWQWNYTLLSGPLSPTNPQNPQNTGTNELLVFRDNYSWEKYINNLKVDSGTYSLGHGVREEVPFYRYEYDSIKYFRQGVPINTPDYYYCRNDSLIVNPIFSGALTCYSLPFGGVKIFLKQ